MRKPLPLLRSGVVPSARDPILRYGVAVLSTTLALITALFFSDIAESRLTAFAVTVSAYYTLAGPHSPSELHQSIFRLGLFVTVAFLICWFNAALRAAQERLRLSESNFRSLVTNAPYGICRCDARGNLVDVNPALTQSLGYEWGTELVGRNLSTLYANGQDWFVLADHLRNHEEFRGLTTEWVRKDGSITAMRLSGRAIRDEANNYSFEIFGED